MTRRLLPLVVFALLAVPAAGAVAGPCAQMVVDTQAAIDRVLADRAGSGPSAPESDDALLSRDPTPDGMAQIEGDIGDGVEPEKALAALERARTADEAGDMELCQKELADARDAIGLQ